MTRRRADRRILAAGVSPRTVCAVDELQEQALDQLRELLACSPQAAAVLAHDLHAIAQGRDTLGSYDLLSWWRIRRCLDALTPEQLTDLLGPPPALP